MLEFGETAPTRCASRRDLPRKRERLSEFAARLIQSTGINRWGAPHMNRAWMDRFIDTIEWIAAGFVGIVALNIFIGVLLRNTLNYAIPDSFDIGRMLLGILIFWGIAATSYRGGHITVDLIWANVGPKYQRMIDVFATLVLLFVVTVQTYTLFDKVHGTYNDNVLTFEMHMPTWPFFAIAWAGDAAAVLLIAIRTWRLVFHPEDIHDAKIKTVE
jgi:TRAP-type transport system small permease protein